MVWCESIPILGSLRACHGFFNTACRCTSGLSVYGNHFNGVMNTILMVLWILTVTFCISLRLLIYLPVHPVILDAALQAMHAQLPYGSMTLYLTLAYKAWEGSEQDPYGRVHFSTSTSCHEMHDTYSLVYISFVMPHSLSVQYKWVMLCLELKSTVWYWRKYCTSMERGQVVTRLVYPRHGMGNMGVHMYA